MRFNKLNTLVGWAAFGVALTVYGLTLEETASYWDCGEFIAASYKLEVPHPPGAPFFLLLGRLFSLLALGDTAKVALFVNFMSALASAFTVLFLFWSITLMGRRIVRPDEEGRFTPAQRWMLIGSGLVGALAYAFSDSFWFSAVEAEVYAMSSFFTSVVVWGMLKWSTIKEESRAHRWLILIAYMMGLSIGVHLLNLVTIPALGLIYYFKKYTPSRWGILLTLLISLAVVLFINDFIVPGLPTIAAGFEVFFVNTLGLPFGSGAATFCLFILAGLYYGIRRSQQREKPLLNTSLLCLAFILIGYSSYALVMIRSNFNTPINENAPQDVMSFVRYLKREQYGSRPLLFGPYFTSQVTGVEEGAPIYKQGKDRYEIVDRQFSYVYDKEVLLPRAWDASQADAYRRIIGLKKGQIPTFAQNIYFMIRHQIGTMYMRYFMWNFAGRESDLEMAGWLGVSSWFEKVPIELAQNKGRNNFFMLPLLIGLFGLFFQFSRDKKGFSVVALLFIMLGVAIVVYLNAAPVEPRERDYIYTGSMYAFAFWIGLAVIGLAQALQQGIKKERLSALIAVLVAGSAPAIMAAVGWDDHDRSNRLFSLDSGKNYLTSCAPNAVLYTGGDNDTFMLWYAQEVEDFRTDVRAVVLSYYNTDWYIEQSMQQVNKSAPLPYTLSLYDYRQGGPNDFIVFRDMGIASIDLEQYLALLHKEYAPLQANNRSILPSRTLTLNVDKEKVLKQGIIPKGMENLVVDKMELQIKGNGLEKKDLAFLDLLATTNWERPLYVNYTSLSQFKIDLEPYTVREGNVSRILPVRVPDSGQGLIDTEATYNNLINKYQYRKLDDESVYYSGDYRSFVLNHRSTFNSLALGLLDEGDTTRARKALLFSLEKMPDKTIPYDQTSLTTAEMLFQIGESERALDIAKIIGVRAEDYLSYQMGKKSKTLTNEMRKNVFLVGELQRVFSEHGQDTLAADYQKRYQEAVTYLSANGMMP